MFFIKRRMSVRILALILICLIGASFTGCNIETLQYVALFNSEGAQTGYSYYINEKPIDIKLVEKSDGRYLMLSEDQKMIYSIALKTLQEGETKFSCCNVNYGSFLNEYGRALIALFQDYPEFFWITGQAIANAEFIEGNSIGNVTVELETYEYWEDKDIENAKAKLNATIGHIVSQALKLSSDYEKVKFVHNFIIQNTVYDRDSYSNKESIGDDVRAITDTAYGPLVQGRAMCNGYARAFELIMHKLGIETMHIEGSAGGDTHAWNAVKIDNGYYYIDLTWDDADGNPCEIMYHYFCLSERDISKTHTSNREFGIIEATSSKYNYYVKEGRYLQEYTFDSVNSIVAKAENKNEISIRFANVVELDKAYNDLIVAGNIFKIDCLPPFESYRYTLNKDICIMTLVLDSPDHSTE